jgi:adenylate cyclase
MNGTEATAFLELRANTGDRRFPLDERSVCRIGRSEQNTVVLVDDLVSRFHAMIHCMDGEAFYLTDLGSRNGTFLNNRRATTPTALQDGDRIQIGNHELFFRREAPDMTAPEMPGVRETVQFFALRLITVLVVDIRDFTGLTRELQDEAKLSQIISTFIREAGTILRECGATDQKYIGDAVMAIWQHAEPVPQRKEALPVLTAIARILSAVAKMQEQFGLSAPVRVGAGVNTGLASMGNLGSESAADYTALGDTVNKAFRLESATRETGCDVALGQATYSFVAGAPEIAGLFQPYPVQLKGYREMETMYGLLEGALPELTERLRNLLS